VLKQFSGGSYGGKQSSKGVKLPSKIVKQKLRVHYITTGLKSKAMMI
jgi:hypothetical protein